MITSTCIEQGITKPVTCPSKSRHGLTSLSVVVLPDPPVLPRLSRYFPQRDADDPSSPPPPFHSVIYRHSDVVHPTINNSSVPCKSHELQLKLDAAEKSKWRRRNSNAKLADDPDFNDDDETSFTDETGSVIPTPLSHHARSKRQVGVVMIRV